MKEGEKREKEQRAPKGSSASLLLIIISRRVRGERICQTTRCEKSELWFLVYLFITKTEVFFFLICALKIVIFLGNFLCIA